MEKILGTAKVTSKGQVTIPKDVRDILNLKAGDLVVFIKKNDEIIIRRAEISY